MADAFAFEVARLTGRPLGPTERFAVAVSGGSDSLALMLLAMAAFGDRVLVLTVDHALRAGSAKEAAGVAAICEARGIPHQTLRWQGDKPTGNIQALARAARYALMGDWCAAHGVGWLATAHHRDDVAETLLLRLARGSGSAGLATIRARRDLGNGVALLRPLLGYAKAELAEAVDKAGLNGVDDPSNAATRFDRTQARAALAALPWLDPKRIAASAAHLADSEAALQWAARLAWDSRVQLDENGVKVDALGLPHELQRRLVVAAFAHLDPQLNLRGPDVERLLIGLQSGQRRTLAGIAAIGAQAADMPWRFHIAPKRRI
jgi:tRNA(Ile)-lysidine synthase